MITERFIKRGFVEKIMSEEAKLIKGLQLIAVREGGIHEQSGGLINSLKGNFSLQSGDTKQRLTLRYVKYLRFLDMPDVRAKRKGYHIYNRIVFGRIYGNLIRRIKYGYTDAAREAIIQELEAAFAANPNYHF